MKLSKKLKKLFLAYLATLDDTHDSEHRDDYYLTARGLHQTGLDGFEQWLEKQSRAQVALIVNKEILGSED